MFYHNMLPGTVETPSWHNRLIMKFLYLKTHLHLIVIRVNESDNPELAKKNFIARQALGRLGTAEEIAALVTYLASDEVISPLLTFLWFNVLFRYI